MLVLSLCVKKTCTLLLSLLKLCYCMWKPGISLLSYERHMEKSWVMLADSSTLSWPTSWPQAHKWALPGSAKLPSQYLDSWTKINVYYCVSLKFCSCLLSNTCGIIVAAKGRNKQLLQGHSTGKWQSQDLKLVRLPSDPDMQGEDLRKKNDHLVNIQSSSGSSVSKSEVLCSVLRFQLTSSGF